MKKKSVYRYVLAALAALQLAGFFLLPYARSGILGSLANSFGMGGAYPENLTGFAMAKLSGLFEGDAMILLIIFVVPPFLSLCVLLETLIMKSRRVYAENIAVAVINAGVYFFESTLVKTLILVGYEGSVGAFVLIALAVAQLVVAILGLVMDKEGAAGGKKVKAGKKDGKLIGTRGAYMGAEIPLKNGELVVIGRDPAVCSVVVKDEKASRKHCEIVYNAQSGLYQVTDCSSNGTFRGDGTRLLERSPVMLSAGETLAIGQDGETFRLG